MAQQPNFEKYRDQPVTQTEIRVASIALMPTKWDKPANWHKIEKMVRAAVAEHAQFIVTPEGALEGYVVNEVNETTDSTRHATLVRQFFELGEPINGPYIQQACGLCRELGVFLVLGFLERAGDLLHNTAILIDSAGEIIGHYRKTHFAQGYTINPPFYQPGNDYPVWDTPFGKIGIIICYDRQLPEPARIMALKGARLLVVPAYGSWTDVNGWNTILMRARAYENRMALIFCNPNQSLIIDDHGELKQTGGQDEIVYHTFELNSERNQNHLTNRRPGTYSEIIQPK